MFLQSVTKLLRTCCQSSIPIDHVQPNPKGVIHVNLFVIAKRVYIYRVLECELSVRI